MLLRILRSLPSCSVKEYPCSLNRCFKSSKNCLCLAVLYSPLTFSKRKKSGSAVQISCAYVPDNLPFSPIASFIFPCYRKIGAWRTSNKAGKFFFFRFFYPIYKSLKSVFMFSINIFSYIFYMVAVL